MRARAAQLVVWPRALLLRLEPELVRDRCINTDPMIGMGGALVLIIG